MIWIFRLFHRWGPWSEPQAFTYKKSWFSKFAGGSAELPGVLQERTCSRCNVTQLRPVSKL